MLVFCFWPVSLGSLLWHKFQIQFSYTMHENNHLIRVTTNKREIFGTNECLASSRHCYENENVHLRLWFSTTLPSSIQMYWQYKRRQCSMLVVTPNNWNLNMISPIPMRTRNNTTWCLRIGFVDVYMSVNKRTWRLPNSGRKSFTKLIIELQNTSRFHAIERCAYNSKS